jgi:hypothetical protein
MVNKWLVLTDETNKRRLVDWGYPSWMRFVVGALEGLSAILLVIPSRRTRFLGATTLVFVLTGAVTTHISSRI